MSLKDWIKKVDSAQLNEFVTPQAAGGATAPVNPQATRTALSSIATATGNKDLAAKSGITAAALTTDPTKRTNAQNQALGKTMTDLGIGQMVGTPAFRQLAQKHAAANAQQAQGAQPTPGQPSLEEDIDGMMSSPQSQPKMSEGLHYIRENHKHECKMYEDGWGLDESLYSALVDHYYNEGKIPRGLLIEGGQALRDFVEECYVKDTGLGGNQDDINSGMLDEEGVAEGPEQNVTVYGNREGYYAWTPTSGVLVITSGNDGVPIKTLEYWDDIKGDEDPQIQRFISNSMKPVEFSELPSRAQRVISRHLLRKGVAEGAKWRDSKYQGKTFDYDDSYEGPQDTRAGKVSLDRAGMRQTRTFDPLEYKAREKQATGKLTPRDIKYATAKNFGQEKQQQLDYDRSRKAEQGVAEDITRRGLLKGIAGAVGGIGAYGAINQMEKSQGLDAPNVTTVNGEKYILGRPSLGASLDGKTSSGKYKLVIDDKGNKVYIWNDVRTAGGPARFVRKYVPAEQVKEQGTASGPLDEEMSTLERSLRQSTKENGMFEGKKSGLKGNQGKLDVAQPKGKLTGADFAALRDKEQVEEATKATRTGKIHTADAGGYGRKHADDEDGYGRKHEDDEDDNGKKPKKPAVKKGRGRPKKDSDSDTGEVMKPDFSAFGVNHGKDIKLKPWPKDKTITKKIATKADREEVDEASPSPAAAAKGKPVKKPVTPFTSKKIKESSSGAAARFSPEMQKRIKNATPAGLSAMAEKLAGIGAGSARVEYEHELLTRAKRELQGPEGIAQGVNDRLSSTLASKYPKITNPSLRESPEFSRWDKQLKGLLTEGLTVTTSVGQEGGQDSVSITASNEDAHKLLQILQNAGLGTGVPSHATQPALSTAIQSAQASVAPSQSSTGGSATDDNVETPAGNVSSMPMPRGMAFSIQPEETEIPTEPIDVSIADSEDVIDALGKGHGDSSKSDNGDDALAFLKKAIGHGTEYADGKQEVTTDNTPTPASKETSGTAASAYDEVEESDEDGKKPDANKDGVPDWADKKPGKDDNADEEEESVSKEDDDDKEEVKEGQQKCNECGGLMEDEFHECDTQLNEWANSPDGQSEDEQFKADMDFMTKVLSGGINGQKSTGQTTGPIIASQTNRQGVSEGYNISVAEMMRKLANIK